MTIFDAHGLTERTIVVRTADHGELALSHGMREKSYTAYEKMIQIPLVVSNPLVYSEPRETQAFYSHLDLLPTLAELAGVPELVSHGLGRSMVPVLRDPSASVQDSRRGHHDHIGWSKLIRGTPHQPSRNERSQPTHHANANIVAKRYRGTANLRRCGFHRTSSPRPPR